MSKVDESQVIARLSQIRQMIDRKQLAEAATALNALGTVIPGDPRLFWLGSFIAEASGNSQGMFDAAQKAYSLHPQWPAGALRMAQVHVARKDIGRAIEMVAIAVKLATDQKTLNAQLLVEAAGVCLRVKQPRQARAWLQMAQQMEPGNASVKWALAHAFAHEKQPAQAIELYNELLQAFPKQPRILFDRMLAHLNLEQLQAAAADGETLLQLEPENLTYQYYAARARGETPATQPPEVVSQVFDDYAEKFDQHLVVTLKYKLPKEVAEMILGWYPAKDCDVLDLGCGTGLLGVCLGPMKGVLVGVDLSLAMIEQAHTHGVYDKCHHVNVLDALRETPANQYDVINALDVLVYIGDLTPVIPNARRILTPGGRFIFSCEAAAPGVESFDLPASTQRYTHNPTYVRRLLEDAGFSEIEFLDRVIRYEREAPVHGFVVVARA